MPIKLKTVTDIRFQIIDRYQKNKFSLERNLKNWKFRKVNFNKKIHEIVHKKEMKNKIVF